MAGLTEHDRGRIRAALRRAGQSLDGPGARSIQVLAGQLADAQREITDLIRICERLDRRVLHLEDQLASRPVPAGLTDEERLHIRRMRERIEHLQLVADALGHGPVPYRLTTAAEAYLAGTDDLTNGMSA